MEALFTYQGANGLFGYGWDGAHYIVSFRC
jgi:hypothetical protein